MFCFFFNTLHKMSTVSLRITSKFLRKIFCIEMHFLNFWTKTIQYIHFYFLHSIELLFGKMKSLMPVAITSVFSLDKKHESLLPLGHMQLYLHCFRKCGVVAFHQTSGVSCSNYLLLAGMRSCGNDRQQHGCIYYDK